MEVLGGRDAPWHQQLVVPTPGTWPRSSAVGLYGSMRSGGGTGPGAAASKPRRLFQPLEWFSVGLEAQERGWAAQGHQPPCPFARLARPGAFGLWLFVLEGKALA